MHINNDDTDTIVPVLHKSENAQDSNHRTKNYIIKSYTDC